jgi:hypothetical protein
MNYKSIDFIIKRLPNINNVFEYGSGNSTLFWAGQGKRVVSVEHDENYYNYMIKNYNYMINSVDYLLIKPEMDSTGNPYNPSLPEYFQSSDLKGYYFNMYVNSINKFSDNTFDVVVVDGRARPSCIAAAIRKINHGGMLILDNSNREYYLTHTSHLLAKWDKHVFLGTVRGLLHMEQTTIFIKPMLITEST